MTHPLTYRYAITFETGGREVIEVAIDPATLERLPGEAPAPPDWTALAYERCGNCPLDGTRETHCPLATALVEPVARFGAVKSYDRVYLEVQSNTRIVSQYTTAQQALSSLLGLLSATSGCPRTAWLRPLARFHLPLASDAETIFRASAAFLLERHFGGAPPDVGDALDGLRLRYRELQRMNHAFARRLRSLDLDGDSCVNALIRLDNLTRPRVLDRCLDDLRHMFAHLPGALDSP